MERGGTWASVGRPSTAGDAGTAARGPGGPALRLTDRHCKHNGIGLRN